MIRQGDYFPQITTGVNAFNPNLELVANALMAQQGKFDAAMQGVSQRPEYLRQYDQEPFDQFVKDMESEREKIVSEYRKGVSNGAAAVSAFRNKMRNDMMPGGRFSELQRRKQEYSAIVNKYQQQYKDAPSYMLQSALKNIQVEPFGEGAGSIIDPNFGDYINIPKELDDALEGYKIDKNTIITKTADNKWVNTITKEEIPREELQRVISTMLQQPRFQQQLAIDADARYGSISDQELYDEYVTKVENIAQAASSQLRSMNTKELQKKLKLEGYYAGVIDGKKGPRTEEALNQYIQKEIVESSNNTKKVFNPVLYRLQKTSQDIINPLVDKYHAPRISQSTQVNPYTRDAINFKRKKKAIDDFKSYMSSLNGADIPITTPGVKNTITFSGTNSAIREHENKLQTTRREVIQRYNTLDPALFESTFNYTDPVQSTVLKSKTTFDHVKTGLNAYRLSGGNKEQYNALMKDAGYVLTDDQIENQLLFYGNSSNLGNITNDIVLERNARNSLAQANSLRESFLKDVDNNPEVQKTLKDAYEKYNALTQITSTKKLLNNTGNFSKITDQKTIDRLQRKLSRNPNYTFEEFKEAYINNTLPENIVTFDEYDAPSNIATKKFVLSEIDDKVNDIKFNKTINTNAVLFTGSDAANNVNKKLKDIVEASGIANFTGLQGEDVVNLNIGYNKDGSPKENLSVDNVTFGYVHGRPVMQISTSWGGEGEDKEKNTAVLNFDDMQPESVNELIKEIAAPSLNSIDISELKSRVQIGLHPLSYLVKDNDAAALNFAKASRMYYNNNYRDYANTHEADMTPVPTNSEVAVAQIPLGTGVTGLGQNKFMEIIKQDVNGSESYYTTLYTLDGDGNRNYLLDKDAAKQTPFVNIEDVESFIGGYKIVEDMSKNPDILYQQKVPMNEMEQNSVIQSIFDETID